MGHVGPEDSGALHPRSVTAAVTPFVRHMGLRCMQGAMPHRGSVFFGTPGGVLGCLAQKEYHLLNQQHRNANGTHQGRCNNTD